MQREKIEARMGLAAANNNDSIDQFFEIVGFLPAESSRSNHIDAGKPAVTFSPDNTSTSRPL